MLRILSNITLFFEESLEGYLSASEIKEFVLKNFEHLKNDQQKDLDVNKELTDIKRNLVDLGWIKLNEPLQVEKKNIEKDSGSKVYQWVNNLKNGRVIAQRKIAKGAGENLDWLDENNEDMNGFKTIALESLLRIVEVQRKKIFFSFSQELTGDEKIKEGLRISILFSRISRRHYDLRYLNAALKMNDWYHPTFKSTPLKKSFVYYLLALTEQERSAAELLR